jgi:tRNA 2-thiouridine synthesizing protein A
VTLYQLDARNLLCPMPVINTQKRVATLSPGDELEICCTDPGALSDIPAWCKLEGHEVVSLAEAENGECLIHIRVH